MTQLEMNNADTREQLRSMLDMQIKKKEQDYQDDPFVPLSKKLLTKSNAIRGLENHREEDYRI